MNTNKKHFEYFKKRCNYWISFFHLGYWDISFSHIEILKSFAHTKILCGAGEYRAVICLTKNWGKTIRLSTKELDRLALHEVLHILSALPEEEGIARLSKYFL